MSPQARRATGGAPRRGSGGGPRRSPAGRAPQPELDRSACTACRGTGQVISGLGGEPHGVTCPWCEGTGRFIAEHNAQEKAEKP